MHIGCCCKIEDSPAAHAAGFDYIECTVVSLIPDQDDAAFAPILSQYQASPLPIQAFNVFLPGNLKVVGPDVDQERLTRYVRRAIERVQKIGARVVVFGSGGARSLPESFPRDEAMHQIVHFLHVVADVADRHDVTIAIEPLNRRESNVINSVAEAAALAQRVDRPSIQALADFYHMDEEHEPLEHIVHFKDRVVHVHVADTGRHPPGTGQYPYQAFAQSLREAKYNRLVSIECRWNDFETEAPPAVRFLRQTLG